LEYYYNSPKSLRRYDILLPGKTGIDVAYSSNGCECFPPHVSYSSGIAGADTLTDMPSLPKMEQDKKRVIRMKSGISVLFALFFVVTLIGVAQAQADSSSGCVQCHTDEGALKSLFKPPKTLPAEGEG
jgi:hypothetical protein